RTFSFDDFVASYYEQIAALVAGGVDMLAVETGNDILVLKACLFAIDKYAVDLMRPAVESLAQRSRRPTSVYPNAGLPDGMGGFVGLGKDGTARALGEFARQGWVNIVGGCCGTTPEWIAAIAKEIQGVKPRPFSRN